MQDFLTGYRLTLRMKCEGLDPEQLARRSVPRHSSRWSNRALTVGR
jgi:hypothetical protein